MAIKHEDVKASGQKGYASEWNKDHVIDGDVDVAGNQLLNMAIERRTDWPAAPVVGRPIYRTDLFAAYIYDGTNWLRMALRTNYWSACGADFNPQDSVLEALYEDGIYSSQEGAGNISLICRVDLPHGAVIVAAEVFGDDGTKTWKLRRVNRTGTVTELASATVNTEDVTITNATVDNENYGYFFEVVGYPYTKVIYGARVTFVV